MRILRSRSDQEVSSTGFALFMAGLIFAGFVGGAIRTVLSSDQIQNRILTELQAALPNLQVKMESAHVSLARGIWPGLSIAIPKLHLLKPEACGETHGTLELEDISLPLDLLSLLRSNIRWDIVSVERLSLVYSRKICAGATPVTTIVPTLKAQVPDIGELTDSAEKVRASLGQAFVTAQGLEKHLRGVRIKKVEISAAEDPSWQIEINDLSLRTGHRLTIYTKIRYEKAFGLGRIEHEATLTATADSDELKWDLKSPLKEGLITWTGVANQAHDQLDQKVTIRQIPLKDVLSEVQTWAGVAKGGSPRFIWLSCDLTQSGALSQFKQIPMEISDCKIDGEGEQIRSVPGQQVWPWERTPLHQPLRFQVNKLSLQTIFDLSAKEGLPAILPKLGQWTGELQFSNPRSWQMDGVLEGAEIIFSNQNVRGKQIVGHVKTLVQAEDDRVRAELSDLALNEGVSVGKIQFRFDSNFKTGDMDVDFGSFSFSPTIQNLMTGGVSTPMTINGHGHVEHGEWQSWRGFAQWKNSRGPGWLVIDPKVETSYAEGIFTLNARARGAQVDADFSYLEAIKKLLGESSSGATPSWNFADLSATALISKAGGEIKNFRVHGPQGKSYHFHGSWDRGGELDGFVDAASAKKWKVRGWDAKLVLDGQ